MVGMTAMMLGLSAGGGLRPQDVFAASAYTGTGAAQTITNGLDLAGKGGLVWGKSRSFSNDHALLDTLRGVGKVLFSDLTNAETNNASSQASLTAFLGNGFSLGTDPAGWFNSNGSTYVAWAFRRAAKFFDVVTYTGDGTSGRQIAHGLGIAPGMIVVKRRDAASSSGWYVYHRSITAANCLFLNTTNASVAGGSGAWNSTEPTATTFTLGSSADLNAAGGTYVAELYAHDPDTVNGIIQCVSAPDGAAVNLGWQPQFTLSKNISSSDPWVMRDATRGFGNYLVANTSAVEASANFGAVSSTGFTYANSGSGTNVHLAIRAPM